MWKKALQILLESCVYMHPEANMYLAAAEREEAERAWSEQGKADEEQIRRLIKWLESPLEAQA